MGAGAARLRDDLAFVNPDPEAVTQRWAPLPQEQWEQIDVAESRAHTSVRFDRDGDHDQANSTLSELFPEIADGGAGFSKVDRFNEIANILFVEE